MRILIDCDVLLDVALRREPHFGPSAAVLDWAEAHPGHASIAWHTAANLLYLAGPSARGFLADLIGFAEIPATDTASMGFALALDMGDAEDAMQVAAASRFGAQWIVTRNVSDYRKSPIQSVSPEEALALLSR